MKSWNCGLRDPSNDCRLNSFVSGITRDSRLAPLCGKTSFVKILLIFEAGRIADTVSAKTRDPKNYDSQVEIRRLVRKSLVRLSAR